MKAISIRQPWAWFILCGFPWAKDVENREWPAPRELLGRWIQIHAAKAMSDREFDDACKFALEAGARIFPQKENLRRGGIVGIVRLIKCVRLSTSPWFIGKYGFVLADPYPLKFEPCIGDRGFFTPQIL